MFRTLARRTPSRIQRGLRIARNPSAAYERDRILRVLAQQPERMPSAEILRRLRVAWGGEATAGVKYMETVCARSFAAPGPILECGSGLTTLLLAIYSRRPVWSLEESPDWAKRMRAALKWYGLDGVTVLDAPIVQYDAGFYWYGLGEIELPEQFALAVCDGPTSYKKEDLLIRFGLVPVMGSRLTGACILLDDAERRPELEVIRRWSDLGWRTAETVRDGRKAFAALNHVDEPTRGSQAVIGGS